MKSSTARSPQPYPDVKLPPAARRSTELLRIKPTGAAVHDDPASLTATTRDANNPLWIITVALLLFLAFAGAIVAG
ncbi:MAG: hypothetical protein R3E75_03990 [Steroidobacteraceae bacterium]|nr:hypothetical protein [Nevskiaceae bacterium]MCP5340391.1 hypothetical protein [Nevskiaceae bacterium]MCP5360231.1 hypothetical protein [Nevskiaceae bacterium]MCP5466632.1 hypothetical protein [Nevskiaceae bacterium]